MSTTADTAPSLDGYLSAVQNLVTLHDQPGMAVDLLSESGYSREELLKSQRSSDFLNEKMIPLIKEATS